VRNSPVSIVRCRKAYGDYAFSNPELIVEMAKKRNEIFTVPNQPTSSRMRKPEEQKLLTI
jgi:hypothetical protein